MDKFPSQLPQHHLVQQTAFSSGASVPRLQNILVNPDRRPQKAARRLTNNEPTYPFRWGSLLQRPRIHGIVPRPLRQLLRRGGRGGLGQGRVGTVRRWRDRDG